MDEQEREDIRERLHLEDRTADELREMVETVPLDTYELEAVNDELRYLEGMEEHRTGRRLPDGSWEPGPYSSWTDANPEDEDPLTEERRLYEEQHGHPDPSST
jgi:hypothetical protein